METINPSGNWSSYPPHKHDENSDHEVKMEEISCLKLVTLNSSLITEITN